MSLRSAATCLSACLAAACLSACRSKSGDSWQSPEIAALADSNSLAVPGAFYEMKNGVHGFFYDVPKFTDVLPEKYLMGGHVVQLLSPNAMDGWARIRSEKLGTGFVKFKNIRIVESSRRPRPRYIDPDEALDRRLKEGFPD
jgi:hypothetical protein